MSVRHWTYYVHQHGLQDLWVCASLDVLCISTRLTRFVGLSTCTIPLYSDAVNMYYTIIQRRSQHVLYHYTATQSTCTIPLYSDAVNMYYTIIQRRSQHVLYHYTATQSTCTIPLYSDAVNMYYTIIQRRSQHVLYHYTATQTTSLWDHNPVLQPSGGSTLRGCSRC